ncbi:MAG TPA: hypothetical protein VGW39_08305 [Chthoniobacterales bacterium]|nr:hypothetical protein [Chthoniobacterales bacterium]
MRRFFELMLGDEPQGGGSRNWSLRALAFIGIFLAWWILTAVVYRHTQSNFLRAESGWYLFLSHSAPAPRHDFEKVLSRTSFRGHYTPFAFLAEFMTARLVGTNAGFWKWRQITVLAVLATMVFLFVRKSGSGFRLSSIKANLCAAGLTTVLIFQAQMRYFVAWPFMILQLFWLLCTVIAWMSLIQMVRRPAEKLWPWLAAGTAYASLHFIGLGLATVGATAAALAGIWVGTRESASSSSPKVILPLLSMIALTGLHTALALRFYWKGDIPIAPAWQPTSFVVASLGFISNFALATARSLFSANLPTLNAEQIAQDWPYGLAILLGFGLLVSSAFFRVRREPTAWNQTRFILRTFASILFLTIIALTATREGREPSPEGFAGYLTGSRHLIPGAFALAGVMSEFLFLLASGPILFAAFLNMTLAVCAITGNLHYVRHVYPEVTPNSMISHAHAWQSVLAMARECRKANLPIPNVPLGALTQEFDGWDLKLFEPLLRADLLVPPGTSLEFLAWPGFVNELPSEYSRDVPSLGEVRKKLRLKTKK